MDRPYADGGTSPAEAGKATGSAPKTDRAGHGTDSRRRFLAVLVAAALAAFAAIGLGACSSGSDNDSSGTEEQAVEAEDGGTVEDETETPVGDGDGDDAAEEESGFYGALHVEGTQLCDEDGNAVQLRGVSTHGLAWYPEYVNGECFAELHDEWGANVVRLALYTAESGGWCTDGDQDELREVIDEGVEAAVENDMYVIIDWHILSDGDPNTYIDEACDFFGEISEEYADVPNVIYEICNEPNGSTTWDDVKEYAETVIPVIRANAPDAVILVGTPNWSQYVDQAADDPIEGYDDIMYTLHFYAATHTDDLRQTLRDAVEDGLPVFVSEYGICDASGSGSIDADSADEWVELMDELGVSYVAWNLSNKDETSALIDSSCDKTSGFDDDDLSESGEWLVSMLSEDGSLEASDDSEEDGGDDDSDGSSDEDSGSVTQDGITCTWTLRDTWESEGDTYRIYDLELENGSDDDVSGWTLKVTFDDKVELSDSWNGTFSAKKKTLTIGNESYNGTIGEGATVQDIGFIVSGDAGFGLTDIDISVE